MALLLNGTESKNISWKEVYQIIANGEAEELLPVGTELLETLKDGRKVALAVAAVNLYGDNEVIFVLRNSIGQHYMNLAWYSGDGWETCDMRTYLNQDVLALFPDDLVELMGEKNTLQLVKGKMVENWDKLFLPSEYEVFGERVYAEYNGIDKQFPLYTTREQRMVTDADGKPVRRWLSSFTGGYTPYTAYFCHVHAYGHANISASPHPHGVVPGFVIRKKAEEVTLNAEQMGGAM